MKLEIRNSLAGLLLTTEDTAHGPVYVLYKVTRTDRYGWKRTRSVAVALRWATAIAEGRGYDDRAYVTPILGVGVG